MGKTGCKLLKRVVCVGLLGAFSATAEEVVYEEDFEKPLKGWCLEDWKLEKTDWSDTNAMWKVVKGVGLDGTAGLVLTLRADERPKWPLPAMFKVEPGEAYRFEAWMDDSAFRDPKRSPPIGISFAPYDRSFRHYRGAGSVRVEDNVVRKDRWVKVEGTTSPMPTNVVQARFYIWANDGSSGTAKFDRFKVVKVAANPLEYLGTSAYRDMAADGEVSFAAVYTLNPVKYRKGDVSCELSFAGIGGTETRAVPLEDGIVRLTLPVSACAFGTNTVRMALKDRTGSEIGVQTVDFCRVRKLPRRRVTFDRYGRTIVDGRKFLPLGMYFGSKFGEAEIAFYTNGTPFNCILPYRNLAVEDGTPVLDLCERAGLKYIVCMSGYYGSMLGNRRNHDRFTEEYVKRILLRYRSHPAVLAWYLADELTTNAEPLLRERKRICYALDPDHPTYVVQNRPDTVRPFVNGYDVIGMDPYPVGSMFSGRIRPEGIRLAADWSRAAVSESYGFRPSWIVPQAFDWGNYYPDWRTKYPDEVRMPTFEELRSMTFQGIAGGANGLIYYSFFDIYEMTGNRRKTEAERDAYWADVVAVAKEVKSHEAVILSDPGPSATCASSDVVSRTWHTESGKDVILLCNVTRSPIETVVSVGGRENRIALKPLEVLWKVL